MGDSLVGTTKNIVIPLGTVYANRTTWVRAESAKKSCKKRVFSPSILMVHLIHVGNEVQQLVGIAPLVVLSLSVKFPFKHLKTRHFRYNSHIIWGQSLFPGYYSDSILFPTVYCTSPLIELAIVLAISFSFFSSSNLIISSRPLQRVRFSFNSS